MTYTNKTIETQINHRTIRSFLDKDIPEKMLEQLLEVVRFTATSSGMQATSIIRITDKKIKKAISEICRQDYVADAAELLIFVVDQHRNKTLVKEQNGSIENFYEMDHFFSGFTDAAIAAQNLVVAAESLGLGTVYLGSVLNDVEKLTKLLKLPQLVFPVVGIGLGYPDQMPQHKPRLEMENRVFENEYTEYDNYLSEIKDYDELMTTYYDSRKTNKKQLSFSEQLLESSNFSMKKRQDILFDVSNQGFNTRQDKSKKE